MNTLSDFASGTAPDLLVRISLILAIAWLLAGALRQRAAGRHAILLAGIVSAFVLPAAMLAVNAFPVPRWSIEVATAATPVSAGPTDSVCLITTKSQENYVVRTAGSSKPESAITTIEPCDAASSASSANQFSTALSTAFPISPSWQLVLPIAVATWAIVALFRSFGLALSLARLRTIVRHAHPVEPQSAQLLLARIQRRVGLPRPPELRESAGVSAPIAAGIIGNYILVPAGWTSRLTRTELYSVLCHEAAHLARRDHRVVILQELLASLLWFHPLVHLVNRALARAREEICDNFAIRSVDRPAYCAVLFRLAGGRNHDSLLAATSLSSRHWPLEERIRGILDERRPTITGISRSTRIAVIALAVCLSGLTILPAITAAEPEQDAAKQSDTTNATEVRKISSSPKIAAEIRAIRITSNGGNLQIDEAEDGQLHLEATITVDTNKVDPNSLGPNLEDHVQISTSDGVLTITPRVDVDKPNDGLKVDLVIVVPSGLAIEAQANDGDIAVNQVEAKLNLATSDGDIAIKSHSSSSVTAASQDGDIALDTDTVGDKISLSAQDGSIAVRAHAVRGDLNVQSSDGDVTVAADTVAGMLNAQSNEGNITVELADSTSAAGQISLASSEGNLILKSGEVAKVSATTTEGSIEIRLVGKGVQDALSASTAEGDVELVVSPETNADLALVTREGSITIEGRADSGNIIASRLGSGGPKYAIASNSGSIHIKTSQSNAPSP